jgi:predicted nucleotidyltransferase
MLSKNSILYILKTHKEQFSKELGVTRIGLFGSYAKGSQKAHSDIDILVDMPPNWSNMCIVWDILEKEFNTKVDLIREGKHLRKPFIEAVKEEIIYV